MSKRARVLVLSVLAAVAGGGSALAVASFPSDDALAAGPGQIVASDFQFTNPAIGENTVTIDAGSTVTFSYPSGGSFHSVEFTDDQPTSCTQTAGPVLGAVPPLPTFPAGEGWAGTCRFDTPGSYAFVCQAHSFMTGDVVVQGTGTGTESTPTQTETTPTQTETTPTQTETTPTPTETGPAAGPPAPPHISIARKQNGTAVRGSVTPPAGPSTIAVTLLAQKQVVAASKLVRVGSTRKRSKGSGRTSFVAKLNARARLALQRRKRLALTVRVVVTPPAGTRTARLYRVTLRRPR